MKQLQQCGVCARITRDGDHFKSGGRNRETGETPCENFICRQCQREARTNWFVKRQVESIAA
jgi:hypothetical protein